MANHLRLTFAEKWNPLTLEQKESQRFHEESKEAEKLDRRTSQNEIYEKWNKKKLDLKHSPITDDRGLMAGSITTRGSDLQTPRGASQCLDISAGSNHAAIVIQDERSRGTLYSWGLNSMGRLGLGQGKGLR